MRKKKIKELTEPNVLHINPRYGLTYHDLKEIYENTGDWFEMISFAFSYGYLQGSKAAKKAVKA